MKRLLILIISVWWIIPSEAQFKIGVNAGVNISDVSLSLFNDIDSKKFPLYFIGVIPKFQLGERVAVTAEFQYINKGYRTFDFFDNQTTWLKSQHIDFMPEVEFKAIGPLRIGAGPNFAYRFSNHMKVGSGGIWNSLLTPDDPIWDFGLTAAAKLYFNNFYGVIRYKYGFSNMGSILIVDQNGNELGILGEYSRDILIGAGYFF